MALSHRIGRVSSKWHVASAVLIGLLAAGATSSVATAVTPRVAIGALVALPAGTRSLGSVPGSDQLSVEFSLTSRDPAALAEAVKSVTTPGSGDYRHFLARGEFARIFGASEATIATVQHGLEEAGLPSGTLNPDHLSIEVHASATSIERALDVSIGRYRLGSGATFLSDKQVPTLPEPVGSLVSAVMGLDTRAELTPAGLVRLSASNEADVETTHVHEAISASATCETEIDDEDAGYTPDEIASAYDLGGLYAEGDTGAGTSIGVIEFSTYNPSDLAAYDSCFSIDPSVQAVPVDGGPTGFNGSSTVEAELDIEDLSGLAPSSAILVYEGAAQSGNVSNEDAYNTFAAAIQADQVKVVTSSWGTCEASIDKKTLEAENTIFEQAALQGQTIIAAAGDSGSEDCYGTLTGSQGKALAVDDPASQPFVTGVGGTTLSLAPTRSEVVWNTGSNNNDPGAGGGGVSSVWSEPLYQKDSASSLGAASASALSGACSLKGGCREVPDVAANAGSPYAIYCTSQYCSRFGWTGLGGTSAAAPTVAAIVALADSSTACTDVATSAGERLGFINPELYEIASGSGYSAAFNDITSGNNDLLGTNGGKFSAASDYDLASGLGSPIAGNGSDGALISQLCTPAVVEAASATSGLPGPTVKSVSPNAGSAAGNQRVVLTGTDLSAVSSVMFGVTPAASFRIASAAKVIAFAPAGIGKVHVWVVARLSKSTASKGNIFTFVSQPILLRVAPRSGPSAGGETVVIIGTGFTRASVVRFGTARATIVKVRSPKRIIVRAPVGHGTVRVSVASAGGRSPVAIDGTFTYR